MKTVLFIAYDFIPSSNVASKRILHFCKHLPEFGYTPVVLTVNEKYYDTKETEMDVNDINDINIYRTCFLTLKKPIQNHNPLRHFFYYIFRIVEKQLLPDQYITWLPFALNKAKKIFLAHDIDYIYATGPHFSTFIIAYFLKRWFKKPILLEYRDQWCLNCTFKSSAKAKYLTYLDKKLIKLADKIIFSSPGFLKEYSKLFNGEEWAYKVHIIPNSYDEDNFKNIKSVRSKGFVVTYAGSFYGPRKPDNFIEALWQLRRDNMISENDVRFVCLGHIPPKFKLYQEEGFITLKEWVSHKQAINYMANSDLLLLIVGTGHEANIPAKFYEYLAIGKPILALCPNGSVVQKMVNQLGCGVTVDVYDVQQIKAAVYALYKDRELSEKYKVDKDRKAEFSSVRTTQMLVNVFTDISY